MKNKKVVIEVLGGVAYCTKLPYGVDVIIKDYDNKPMTSDVNHGKEEKKDGRQNQYSVQNRK
jgi:hypothetical protein